MPEIIKVEISTALAKKFRRKAIEVYGYEKGSVKVVLEDLIKRFVAIRGTEWRSMKGALKLKANSIELQHHAWIMPD